MLKLPFPNCGPTLPPGIFDFNNFEATLPEDVSVYGLQYIYILQT